MPEDAAARELIEVIPGRLLWAPEVLGGEAWTFQHCTPLPAMDLITKAGALYAVPHYPLQAVGKAFGPVALDKTLEFCAHLFEAMGKEAHADGRCLALATPRDNIQTRTNVATMLGAYLVLRHNWSAKKVRQILGEKDAGRMFACSWSRAHKKEEERHHRVFDCWAGIELAKQLEWISPSAISDPQYRENVCKRVRHWSTVYDGAWIVPGRIVVTADPSTTACDPNPATFNKIFPDVTPDASDVSTSMGGYTSSGTEDTINGDEHTREYARKTSVWSATTYLSRVTNVSALSALQPGDEDSTDTVCKDYTGFMQSPVDGAAEGDGNGEIPGTPDSFVSHLKQNGVKVMIRCNYADEPGMPEASYDSEGIRAHGIHHADLVVPDYDGGLPTRSGIRKAVELSEAVLSSLESPNAIAVHCKGGFGRSVVLACCVAIDHYDIPGHALLGWVRVVRPGAVTHPIQEKFLKKLSGRAALRQYAGMEQKEDDELQRPPPTCGVACSIM